MTNKHAAVVFAMAFIMVAPLVTEAQQSTKVARVGILRAGTPPDPFVDGFRERLAELGYTEGQDISIEIRWAEGREERLPRLAVDLVRLKVDVILAGGGGPVQAVRQATNTIPIVMPVSSNPVRMGLVASLARPGGNVTGLATLDEELPGKWIELLKETLPGLSRVAIMRDPTFDISQVKPSEVAARSLGVRVQVLKVSRASDFEMAFGAAQRSHAQALIVMPSAFFYAHRTDLVAHAAKRQLPTIYHQKEFVVGSGGLMSYGPDYRELFRSAAGYVDKILKGANQATFRSSSRLSSSWSSTSRPPKPSASRFQSRSCCVRTR
jgi:putative ABC transport system substrate-binding protein